jgi:hypothetical protein
MAYTIALPLTTALLNTIGQYLSTGKMPDEAKDLLLGFKNGLTDSHGTLSRSMFPTYMKDVYGWLNNPAQTATNKIHPLLSALAELVKNKNYYGVEIHNKNDSYLKQAGDIAKFAGSQFLPFSATGGYKNYQEGAGIGKMLLPQIGITPAPASINQTAAQKVMSQIYADKKQSGAMSQADFDKMQNNRQLAQGVRNNGGNATPELYKAVASQQVTPQHARDMMNVKGFTGLQNGVYHMGIDDSLKIWNEADSTERTQLQPILRQKIIQAKIPNEQKVAYMQKIGG